MSLLLESETARYPGLFFFVIRHIMSLDGGRHPSGAADAQNPKAMPRNNDHSRYGGLPQK